MKRSQTVILLTVALILIALGIGGIIYCFIADRAPADGGEAAESGHIKDGVEYIYDEQGNIKTEVYYKDGSFDGKKDYYNTKTAEYVTVFDKDMNEIASSKTEKNVVGSVTVITEYEEHQLVRTVEFNYGDDMRTVIKKTEKTFEGEDELAEKTYYSESGVMTRLCSFKNGELLEDTYFDENGNVIENGGETSEE